MLSEDSNSQQETQQNKVAEKSEAPSENEAVIPAADSIIQIKAEEEDSKKPEEDLTVNAPNPDRKKLQNFKSFRKSHLSDFLTIAKELEIEF